MDGANNYSALNQCTVMNDLLREESNELSTYWGIQCVFAVLYGSIIVFAAMGNSCVVVAITSDARLRTQVQNVLIVSLSVSDCVVLLISGIITPTSAFAKQWYFGAVLCRLVPLLQGITIFISTLTLTVIALDRYMLVVLHKRQAITLRQTYIIIVSILIVAAAISTPPVLFSVYESVPTYCGVYCFEQWPNDRFRVVYGSSVLILQFLLPTTIIAFCYTSIFRIMSQGMLAGQKQSKGKNGTSSGSTPSGLSEERMAAMQRRQRRTTKMLIGMVVAFGCSWFPQVLYMLLRDLGQMPAFAREQIYFMGICTHCLSMTSTLCNPILYAWLNEQLRAAFVNVLPVTCRAHVLRVLPAPTRSQAAPPTRSRVNDRLTTTVPHTHKDIDRSSYEINQLTLSTADANAPRPIITQLTSINDNGLQLTLLFDEQHEQML